MSTTPAPAPYRLRSIAPRDEPALRWFYAGLSADSRAARFHGASPSIPAATATFFCGSDHEHREGIVAERIDATGEAVIIGHVCIEPVDAGVVELAIAVADAWQGHGVGRAMLVRAIAWAQLHGVARLVASVQCGNAPMFALLRSTGWPIAGASFGGTVDATLDLRTFHPLAA